MSPAPRPFPILLLDGGLGTTLEDAHSIKFGDHNPLWSSDLLISSPETLLAAQKSFVDAGVDILLSATYQASYEGFAMTKRKEVSESGEGEGYSEEEAESYMRSAIPLARQAFTSSSSPNTNPKSPKIALSLGAYGAILLPSQEYTGNYDPLHTTTAQLRTWHQKRLEIFQNSPETWYNIDYIAFETIPRIEEIEAVREAVFRSEGGWDRKFWVSCVFPGERQGEGGYRLPDGSGVEDVVMAMLGGGPEGGKALPFGIGVNCTKIGKVRGLVEEFERVIKKVVEEGRVELVGWPFLVLYPDGAQGFVYNTEIHVWESKPSLEGGLDGVSWDEAIFEIVKEVKERGKWRGLIVGGCCKVLPADIAKLRKRIDGLD